MEKSGRPKAGQEFPRSLTRLKIAILMAMLETSIFRHSTDTPVNERLPNEDLSEPVAVWRRWLHPKSTRYLSADRSIKIRSGTQTNNYRMSSNFLRVTFQMGWQCRQINDHLESSSWTLSCAISLSDTGGEVRDGPYPGYHQNSGISQRWPPTPIEERENIVHEYFSIVSIDGPINLEKDLIHIIVALGLSFFVCFSSGCAVAGTVPINLFAQKNKKFPLYGALGKSKCQSRHCAFGSGNCSDGVVGGHLWARSPLISAWHSPPHSQWSCVRLLMMLEAF